MTSAQGPEVGHVSIICSVGDMPVPHAESETRRPVFLVHVGCCGHGRELGPSERGPVSRTGASCRTQSARVSVTLQPARL